MQITDIRIDGNKRETTVHGSYDFPLAVYLDRLDKNLLGYVNWHWHEEIQLALVTKGEVAFHVNRDVHILAAGQGIFINSGCLHMAKPAAAPDSTYICVNADAARLLSFFPGSAIEQKYLKPYLKHPGLAAVVLDSGVEWHKPILAGIEEIYRLHTNDAFGCELDIAVALAGVWRRLIARCRDAAPAAGENTDHRRIKTVMAYIHDHYPEKLTLGEIAAAASISKGECCRLFKRVAGCTVFAYLIGYRIDKSLELLQTTDLTVSQIADRVGFGTASYYIENFKSRLACTPREYRKAGS